ATALGTTDRERHLPVPAYRGRAPRAAVSTPQPPPSAPPAIAPTAGGASGGWASGGWNRFWTRNRFQALRQISLPSPVTAAQANKVLSPTMGQVQGMRKFTYPVCLFLLSLREDQAFFSWLAEPVVTSGGPKLLHHGKTDCVALTDEVLGRVAEQIVAW